MGTVVVCLLGTDLESRKRVRRKALNCRFETHW